MELQRNEPGPTSFSFPSRSIPSAPSNPSATQPSASRPPKDTISARAKRRTPNQMENPEVEFRRLNQTPYTTHSSREGGSMSLLQHGARLSRVAGGVLSRTFATVRYRQRGDPAEVLRCEVAVDSWTAVYHIEHQTDACWRPAVSKASLRNDEIESKTAKR